MADERIVSAPGAHQDDAATFCRPDREAPEKEAEMEDERVKVWRNLLRQVRYYDVSFVEIYIPDALDRGVRTQNVLHDLANWLTR